MSDVTHVTDDSFERDVLNAPGPVLVDYWADWCGPCRIVGPLVEAAADHFGDRLAVAKLDVDANAETPARYGVRSIPTLMLFRDGEPVATQVGSVSEGQLHEFLEPHLGEPAA